MTMVLLVLITTAIGCGLIGIFLVLREVSMVSDAIAHSVLLGIVLGYFLVKDVTSPVLLIGAALFGLIAVYCIELLIKTRLVKGDAATGIIFTLFFSVAVILLSKYTGNAHICADTIVMGEVIIAPLNSMEIFGLSLPKTFVHMFVVIIINTIFLIVFYKELKLTTFDKEFAIVSGFSVLAMHYMTMTLVSLTSVVAFKSVGAILVISFLIAPAATAYLISNRMRTLILLTLIISTLNSTLGWALSIKFNVSMSGACATLAIVWFFIAMLFNRHGVITKLLTKKNKLESFQKELLLIHIDTQKGKSKEKETLGVTTIKKHVSWAEKKLKKYIDDLTSNDMVSINDSKNTYELTEKGSQKVAILKKEYGLSD